MWLLARRILRDLRHAGFAAEEVRAVRRTPPMWAQLVDFYQRGGRVERVEATFSAATGQPGLIRFFCPPAPTACAHANFGALAHELGHALQYPPQWRPPGDFADAQAYARSRELGEAHAWLNQARLCRAKVGGTPEMAQVQQIENDEDFGTRQVDLFAHIAEREAAGWSDARILDELAVLNANMFPSGMGEGNLKTYGQCNRWDWLQATQADGSPFRRFIAQLPRAPHADDQKLLMKFNLFTQPDSNADTTLASLASALGGVCTRGDLPALHALACQAMPYARPGVAWACRPHQSHGADDAAVAQGGTMPRPWA
ncbi:MAG: hypothetical protein Q4G70_05225 [Pseudomonadota bacterium]|nr:hypothetical protein [Pseudomonadota bacterium]